MRLAVRDSYVPGTSFVERLERIEDYGFMGVEVRGVEILEKFVEIREALPSSKVKFSTVCGSPGDLLGGDRKTREMAMNNVKERLEVCAKLGGVGVIVVPTFGGSKIQDLFPWRSDIQEIEMNILIEELKILGKVADDLEVFVILEPLNRYETHFIKRLEQAVDVCETVNIEHVKTMGDFFHMSIEESSIQGSLELAFDYLVHIHLADSNRLLPGQGHINFKPSFELLRKNGYNNYLALECGITGNPDLELPKCVSYLKKLL